MRTTWRTFTLADLLEIQNGFAFDSKKFSSDGDIPLIRIRDLQNGVETQTSYTGEYSEAYVVNRGDLLIGMDGEFRCYKWHGAVALLNQRVCRLQNFADNLDPGFLFYGINSYLQEIEDNTTFTTVKHLSAKTIRNIRFPLPSLPEQQRIVAILDEAFAGIASAVEATEKNLANARELFDSYVNDVFSRKGEGWTKRAIGECFKIKSGDFLPKKVMNMSGEYVVFGGNGPTGNHDQFNLTGNNILIGRVGAKCGNVRVVSDDIWLTDNAFYISKYLIPFHPSFLATMLTKSNLGATANQTAQPVISYKTIRVVPLSFPKNVDTQEQIANDFGLLQKTSENLEAMYRKKLDALTELKQSILQKAFQGELTNGSDKALGGAGL